MNECIYCKSTELEKELPIVARQNTHPVSMGPYYLVETKKFLGQTQHHCMQELMYADLCKKCGSVRMYIKNTEQNWKKERPSVTNAVIWKN